MKRKILITMLVEVSRCHVQWDINSFHVKMLKSRMIWCFTPPPKKSILICALISSISDHIPRCLVAEFCLKLSTGSIWWEDGFFFSLQYLCFPAKQSKPNNLGISPRTSGSYKYATNMGDNFGGRIIQSSHFFMLFLLQLIENTMPVRMSLMPPGLY